MIKFCISAALLLLGLCVTAPAQGNEMVMPIAVCADDEPEIAEEEMQEEDIESAESELAPATRAALDALKTRLGKLIGLLEAVVDARSAAALAPSIVELFTELRSADFSFLDAEDEELVAAEFEDDMFTRLEVHLSRLADVAYFGNETLVALWGAAEDPTAAAPQDEKRTLETQDDTPALESGTESVRP